MLYRFRFVIYGFLILTLGFSFSILFFSLRNSDDPFNNSAKDKELNGIFSTDGGKVYALVPSNGYYEVKGANATTFRVFDGNYMDQHIGYDDRYVYAGNIILKGLNPGRLKVLGNNYYTDGITTYYCARNSEKNESLGELAFVVQLMGQGLGLSDKPQNYWYPFTELPKNKVYQSKLGFALAVNESQAFYRGIELPNANPSQIRALNIRYWDGDVRQSDHYYTDGKHVYSQNQLLPLAYNPEIYVAGIESDIPSRTAFLIDPRSGMVYADGHPFDEAKAPYKLLSLGLKHANQALFVSADGLYFYNSEKEKVERAGNNPFLGGEFTEMAPDVFTSGNKVYFLKASESWGRKSGLQARSTHLLELKNVAASTLRKISAEDNRFGSVWQAGNRYFYFDDMGSSQLMSTAVYEINDIETLKKLLATTDMAYDSLREISRSSHLTAADAETVLTAKTGYGNDWYKSYWLIFGAAGLVFLLSLLFRNKKIAPFFVKDDYLIMNNLLFQKYKIEEINKVLFRSVKTNSGTGGYSGQMQVLMKNGKISRNNVFSTRVTLTSETDTQVITYIRELQTELKAAGIKSELVQ